jgi:general secretion pathway protein G
LCGRRSTGRILRIGLRKKSAINMKKKGFTRTNFVSQNSRGFTLIEILVAASIIAVLSVVGVTSYTSINKRSRDAKRKSDVEQVRSALEMYRADNGSYPGSSTSFIALSSLDAGDGTGPLVTAYMPSIPTDPKSTGATPVPYYYRVIGSGPATYYSYCICANLENESSNTCGVAPIANCTYYLKNP